MKKTKEGTEIKYWIQLTNLLDMDKIIPTNRESIERPSEMLYFMIPEVKSMSFTEESMPSTESSGIKLVFRYERRYETGIVYKFVGYER
jgi:hypothetical protein